MDYNSRPWTYEVVGISSIGREETNYKTSSYENAMIAYNEFKEAMIVDENQIKKQKRFSTVLLCQSRKGMVKGSIEE